MNIQMLAACVKMREAWYELSAESKREDKDFDLIKHITAEKNKIKPEEVTKEIRHETKSSLFTAMYFESYYNDKVNPSIYAIVDDLLVGMYNRVGDKKADISFGTLLKTSGDIQHVLFESDLYDDISYDTACGYFEVSDMRSFMYTIASQDCVAFSTFVREFWKQTNEPQQN